MTDVLPNVPRTRPVFEHSIAGLNLVEWPAAVSTAETQTVIGLHGLTGSGWAWAAVAEAMPETRVLGIDMRGRGGSVGLAGPTGLRAHARDVAAVARELKLVSVIVAGHSMGAYLAPIVAQELGSYVTRIVCVDGAIRPAFPPGLGPQETRAMFELELRLMEASFPSLEAFAAQTRVAPAIEGYPQLRPSALRMLEHELSGSVGELRPRLDVSRAIEDAVDTFFGADVPAAIDALTVPADVLLAEHQLKPTDKPFISDAAVQDWTTRQPLLRVHRFPGNHVTLLFTAELVTALQGTVEA